MTINFYDNNNLALYIHWPFCKSKCPYCDFNSHVQELTNQEIWLKAYLNELEYYSPILKNKQISSIFFGGGTPSLMPSHILAEILAYIHKNFNVAENIEITLEANPTSSEAEKFADFKKAGINRLSIGVQALNDTDLKFLGREHSASEAIEVIKLAAKYFDNYSFDLIYARPGQQLLDWQKELEHAMELAANHISLYQLTIEKGTKFYKAYQNKEFKLPSEDNAFELYENTAKILAKYGLKQYEISNYAKPGLESKHNLSYWHYSNYLGIGPGAHSRTYIGEDILDFKIGMNALMNIHNPNNWLEAVTKRNNSLQQIKTLTDEEIIQEILMMGLRLNDGITDKRLQFLINKNFVDIIENKKLQNLQQHKFLDYSQNHLQLKNKGRFVLNSLLAELLP